MNVIIREVEMPLHRGTNAAGLSAATFAASRSAHAIVRLLQAGEQRRLVRRLGFAILGALEPRSFEVATSSE
jgi:hypothetical protein